MSDIRANTISDAAGTGPITLTKQSAAKAWVNFDGTGIIATRDSENVSSLTDNGTGSYTINFGSAFAAAEYCPLFGNSIDHPNLRGGNMLGVAADNIAQADPQATGSVRTGACDVACSGLSSSTVDSTAADTDGFYAAIFGDLA